VNFGAEVTQCDVAKCISPSLMRVLLLLWPPYGIEQAIMFLPCGFFFYLLLLSSFFLAKSQRSQCGCLPYFYTWCALSANLGCMSEMCCTRLASNTGRKNDAKNRHLGTIAQLCWAVSSQLRHISTIGKNWLSSNTSPTCRRNMVNFSPLTADIGSGVWGSLQISRGFASWQRYCTAL